METDLLFSRIVRGAGFRQPVFRSQIERGGKGDIAAARFAFQAGLDLG